MEETKNHSTHKEETKSIHNHASHKKHENKEEVRKPVDEKKSLIIVMAVVLFVIIIIIASVLASKYLFKNTNVVEYNNYTFEKFDGNKWMTQQVIRGQLYDIPFYNNPTQVQDIKIDQKSIDAITYFKAHTNGIVYISFNPEESSKVVLAGVEYARILGNAYNIYNLKIVSAITKPSKDANNYQIITCQNQSKNNLVIVQTESDKNLVSIKDNCITIEYINATESIRVADAFAFRLLHMSRE